MFERFAMKYISYKKRDMEEPVIVLFSKELIHRDVAERLRVATMERGLIGAGFVRISNGEAICFGRSESLRMDSDEGDSWLATKALFMA